MQVKQSEDAVLRDHVLAFLSTRTPIDLSALAPDTGLLQAAALDSLQLVELIIWIEGQTEKPVEMELLLQGEDVTVSGIVAYLADHAQATRAS